MPVGSIAAVFEEVNRSHVDFGVVPLENSTDGRVADTLDMFMRMPHLMICAEVRLPIHHNLMANCDPQEIRRVYSKPQALSQCRNWLAKNVPHAIAARGRQHRRRRPSWPSTSQAPPPSPAGRRRSHYGLRILFADIEDYPAQRDAFRRHRPSRSAARPATTRRPSCSSVPHNPGSLVEALDVFKQNKINLTWIESFPAKSAKHEYIFFVDFEGHVEEPKVARALKALNEHCEKLTVLGSFPIAR